MITRDISRQRKKHTLSLSALVLILHMTGSLVTTSQAQNAPEEIEAEKPMSMTKLRREFNRAREAMFDRFNELNDDERFDIKCKYVKRWQSKIRERVCGPAYFANAQNEQANLMLRDIGKDADGVGGFAGASIGGAGVAQMDYMDRQLKEKMERLVRQNEGFKQLVDRYNVLQEEMASR
jgi:hypothetical protein